MAVNETSGIAEDIDMQSSQLGGAMSETITTSSEARSEGQAYSAAIVANNTGRVMDKTINTSDEVQYAAQVISAASIEKLTSFAVFPKLAPEMRNTVWKWICFITRDVDVEACEYTYMRVDNKQFRPCWFASSKKPPAILQVSKEARREGLRYYKLKFGTRQMISRHTMTTPPRIYFNPLSDRICFFGTAARKSTKNVLRKLIADHGIRRIAVNVRHHISDNDLNLHLHDCIQKWFRLDMQEIVVYSSRCSLIPLRGIGIDYEFCENNEDTKTWPEALKITTQRIGFDPVEPFKQVARDLKSRIWETRRKEIGDPAPKDGQIPLEELEEISGPVVKFMVLGKREGTTLKPCNPHNPYDSSSDESDTGDEDSESLASS